MLRRSVLPALALALLVPSAAHAAKVEVTRFHTPTTLVEMRQGGVEVVAAPGADAQSLETRALLALVAAELTQEGIAVQPATGATRRVEVRQTRDLVEGASAGGGNPVRVGVGVGGTIGGGGGYYRRGSGVGVGIGVGFGGGGSRSQGLVEHQLQVTIRDSATGNPLWEGRSVLRAGARSREADSAAVSRRLVTALFDGFPGASGETIEVR